MSPLELSLTPLTAEAFAPYGDVVSLPDVQRTKMAASSANQGTASRYNYVAKLVNSRNSGAKPNLCLFNSTPPESLSFTASVVKELTAKSADGQGLRVDTLSPYMKPFSIRLLERHPNSSQIFVPLKSSPFGYIVIVSCAKDGTAAHQGHNRQVINPPDVSSLVAFWAQPWQAVNYHPNVWHHPIITLGTSTQFVCLVWESASAGLSNNLVEDTEEFHFERPLSLCAKIRSKL
jgi:ureidoglycolate hydrolase